MIDLTNLRATLIAEAKWNANDQRLFEQVVAFVTGATQAALEAFERDWVGRTPAARAWLKLMRKKPSRH